MLRNFNVSLTPSPLMGEGGDEGENIGKITSPHLNPLPQGERKIGLMKSAPNLFFKVWLGVVLLIMVIIFLPVQLVQAAVEGVSSIATSGAWDDGAGAYSAGNYSVPAGFSAPVMPSFSSNSITPTYYFDRSLRVNSAGFTTMGGSFTNPAAIAFTSLPNSTERHGIPVWFHNGLDGIAFHHQSVFVSRIDQSFIKGLGLDKVTFVEQRQVYHSDGTHLQTRDVYQTGIGLQIDYAAVQSQAFINENLTNMVKGGYSTKSERPKHGDANFNSDADALSNAAAQVNYYSLGKGNVLMAINKPEDFFHWNYSSGAYVQPGDVLYYEGNQRIEGFGTTKDFQQLNYTVHNITGRGIAVVAPSGNLLSIEGRVKNIPIQNSLNPAQAMPVTAEVSFRNGVIEPKEYKERNQRGDFNPEVAQLNSGISRDSLSNPYRDGSKKTPMIGQGMEIADLNSGEEIYKDSDLEISEDEIKKINQAGWPVHIDLKKDYQITIILEGLGNGRWVEDISKQLNDIIGKAKKERVEGVIDGELNSKNRKTILVLDLKRYTDLQVYREIMKVLRASGEIVKQGISSFVESILNDIFERDNAAKKDFYSNWHKYHKTEPGPNAYLHAGDCGEKNRQEMRGLIDSLFAVGWEREVVIDTMANLLVEKKNPVGSLLEIIREVDSIDAPDPDKYKKYADDLVDQIIEKSADITQINAAMSYSRDSIGSAYNRHLEMIERIWESEGRFMDRDTFVSSYLQKHEFYLSKEDSGKLKLYVSGFYKNLDDNIKNLEQNKNKAMEVIKTLNYNADYEESVIADINEKSYEITESIYQNISSFLAPAELSSFISVWGKQVRDGLSPENQERIYSNLETGLSLVIGRPVNRETVEKMISVAPIRHFFLNEYKGDGKQVEIEAREFFNLLAEKK